MCVCVSVCAARSTYTAARSAAKFGRRIGLGTSMCHLVFFSKNVYFGGETGFFYCLPILRSKVVIFWVGINKIDIPVGRLTAME